MQDEETARRIVEAALAGNRYAVLATESRGQPHATLMAFAPLRGGRELVFATYRGTRKHANLVHNPRVAVFIDHEESTWLRAPRRLAVTAVGSAEEIGAHDRDALARSYLARHPDLADFVAESECALVRVVVEACWEVAGGIDDLGRCSIDVLAGPARSE